MSGISLTEMPLIPSGLSRSLFERLKERSKQELNRLTQPVQDLGQRLKTRVLDTLGVETQPAAPQPPPATNAEKLLRIQMAGRNRTMLNMQYNGVYRKVEPYSFRYRDKDEPHVPLFYAFCHKDRQIEAFKIRRIQDLQVTNEVFSPRWPVEF